MLDPKQYLEFLGENGVNFYAGVPDSLLKQFCACAEHILGEDKHIIAANEGGALGLAIGYHLATGNVPLVYLQNSGLGNLVNPLLSLASPEVYGVPMVILIGWRGEPNVKDEPQHVHQGRITPALLDAMDVDYIVAGSNEASETLMQKTATLIKTARDNNKPVAILVQKDTFSKYAHSPQLAPTQATLEREEAVEIAANACEENAVIVCTTGMLSRELFEIRAKNNAGHQRDFLCVGGMGHASQIATAIALQKPDRPVYCFDGDGASLMHMGSMAIAGNKKLSNLRHIVFNNGCHESVGGQPTVALDIDIKKIADAMNYFDACSVETEADLKSKIQATKAAKGTSFIEVIVRPGHRSDIGRPTSTPAENKNALMGFIRT